MTTGPSSYIPDPVSWLAGARCPACGARLSAWELLKTGRIEHGRQTPSYALPVIPCRACNASVALGGSAFWQRVAFIGIIVPVIAASVVTCAVTAIKLGAGQDSGPLLALVFGLNLTVIPAILSVWLLGVEERDLDVSSDSD